jgi:DNA-directed RNA polymerase subunit RPC12/RpoP
MVTVKKLQMWNMSFSMLFGKSPKINYICGKCDSYNETRIPMNAVRMEKPYVVCSYCGEVNDTKITLE